MQKHNNHKIRLLIIEDSLTVRGLLNKILIKSKDIEIIDSVGNAYDAASIVVKRQPDVITLDITMPGMDGLTFLEKLMKNYPTPVIMFSAYTSENTYATKTALKLGAVDYLQKPININYDEYERISKILATKIIKASNKVVKKLNDNITFGMKKRKFTEKDIKKYNKLILKYGEKLETTDKIILIGSSTGGTDAIANILNTFPSKIPPTIITQHMPHPYTKAWAGRLNTLYDFDVVEASDSEEVIRNKVYIAPGGKHLALRMLDNGKLITNILDISPVNSCKPSVDVLFNSVKNESLAKKIIAVILTGMGSDGAEGMLNIKKLGGYTIAQNKESCIVYGMPKSAIDNGSINSVLPLKEIAIHILDNL